MAGLGAFALLAVSGKPIKLPVWAVAEVETRINIAVAEALTDLSLSVGAIEVMVDKDWVPRLALEDLRILQKDGTTLVALPEVRASFDPKLLITGRLRPQNLRVIGGRFAVKRNPDGRLDLDFGTQQPAASWRSIADVLDAVERAFAAPTFAQLTTIEAEALTLVLTDARSGQQWQAGDGKLVLENSSSEMAAQLSLSIAVDQTRPARIEIGRASCRERVWNCV